VYNAFRDEFFNGDKENEMDFCLLNTLLIWMPGGMELIIILVITLIIFGAGKLPEIGAGLGRGIKEFKKATGDAKEIDVTVKEAKESIESEEKKQIDAKDSEAETKDE